VARNRYRLAFDRNAHVIDVLARFGELDGANVVVRMAAWTPGSYLVRDYARHVLSLRAEAGDGRPLRATKIDKAGWRVDLDGATEVVVSYQVYAHELTVRTNHVDATHAFVNGAPTYLWIPERADEPADVEVDAPGWRVACALPEVAGVRRARDLDELIDSPIHAGESEIRTFPAAGRPVDLAIWGTPEPGAATLDDLVRDVSVIIEAYAAIFGGVPYDRYLFMLMLVPNAHGGLEHKSSSACLGSSYAFSARKRYEELLELLSHEYFHLWNVKRIRPRALGPFDYTRENYTRSLWVCEGLTSYYDRYMVRRTGLQPASRYLEKLAEEWGRLLDTPGRKRQSLLESSFDAWIKLYKPDESTVNSTVSYYLKGGLVTICLDLEVRRRTAGARTLDHVLRRLWERREHAYADDEIKGEIERALDLDLSEFFDRYVSGTEDPDLAGALAGVGLTLRPKKQDEPAGGWLGATLRTQEERLRVAAVLAGGPAEAGGLAPGDEIIAVDGFRVDEKALGERMAARRPGQETRITVFCRDQLTERRVTLGERPAVWEIVPAEGAGEAEQALREGWLGPDERGAP
jgi:predicted metalloprotease with PDZ domain